MHVSPQVPYSQFHHFTSSIECLAEWTSAIWSWSLPWIVVGTVESRVSGPERAGDDDKTWTIWKLRVGHFDIQTRYQVSNINNHDLENRQRGYSY
jgi:hypothetical protein